MEIKYESGDTYKADQDSIWTSGIHQVQYNGTPRREIMRHGNYIQVYAQTEIGATQARDHLLSLIHRDQSKQSRIDDLEVLLSNVQASYAADLDAHKSQAFDVMQTAFEEYFAAPNSKSASDQLLMKVIAAIRGVKKG